VTDTVQGDESQYKKLFKELDAHKKGYLDLNDWKHAFGTFHKRDLNYSEESWSSDDSLQFNRQMGERYDPNEKMVKNDPKR
jgi:hypothetical protein